MNRTIRENPGLIRDVLGDISDKEFYKKLEVDDIAFNNKMINERVNLLRDIETNPAYNLGHQKSRTINRLKDGISRLSNKNVQANSEIAKLNKSIGLLNDKKSALDFEYNDAKSKKPKALGKHLLAVGGTGAVGVGVHKAIKNKTDDR